MAGLNKALVNARRACQAKTLVVFALLAGAFITISSIWPSPPRARAWNGSSIPNCSQEIVNHYLWSQTQQISPVSGGKSWIVQATDYIATTYSKSDVFQSEVVIGVYNMYNNGVANSYSSTSFSFYLADNTKFGAYTISTELSAYGSPYLKINGNYAKVDFTGDTSSSDYYHNIVGWANTSGTVNLDNNFAKGSTWCFSIVNLKETYATWNVPFTYNKMNFDFTAFDPNVLNCSGFPIPDIPCWMKKLFVPTSGYLNDRINEQYDIMENAIGIPAELHQAYGNTLELLNETSTTGCNTSSCVFSASIMGEDLEVDVFEYKDTDAWNFFVLVFRLSLALAVIAGFIKIFNKFTRTQNV